MFAAILFAIPLWVFPLLIGLIWLGIRASKDRSISTWLIYTLPLLGLMSISRAAGLAQAEMAATALGIAYCGGVVWGFIAQRKWIIARSANHVQLRGEWVTMATIIGLFCANFAAGMAVGIAPDFAATGAFAAAFGTAAGLLGGGLFGRALRVWHERPRPTDRPQRGL